MSSSPPSVWALLDDRAGNTSQTLGLAESLGAPYTIKKIHYTIWTRLPNAVRGATLLGVDRERSDPLTPPWPEYVIAAGRRLAPIASFIRAHSNGRTRYVQLMWPGASLAGRADILVLPEHDRAHRHPHLIRTLGAPNRITPEACAAKRAEAEAFFSAYPGPRIALLLGGSNKHAAWNAKDTTELLRRLALFRARVPGSLLVTSSRRTDPALLAEIRAHSPAPLFCYDVTSPGENPYSHMLAIADAIVVTGDSIGMCSESASTGAPVFIYAPSALTAEKFLRFYDSLYAQNAARPFIETAELFSPTPLREAKRVWEGVM